MSTLDKDGIHRSPDLSLMTEKDLKSLPMAQRLELMEHLLGDDLEGGLPIGSLHDFLNTVPKVSFADQNQSATVSDDPTLS